VALNIKSIVAQLGGELISEHDVEIGQVAPLERAGASEIGFVAHAKYKAALLSTSAGAVIVPPSLADATSLPRVVTKDPYLYFAKVAQLLNPTEQPAGGIHPSAVVLSPVPASVHIGPLAYVGEGCQVGENVTIGVGSVVEKGCVIGSGTELHARVTIYHGSIIGARCIIHSGTVIGSDGFGFARTSVGGWEKIPQIGKAVIGDDVEIGANTTIDRGALDDTIIENGVKLDNLIQIAHNCRVGENTAMAAFAGMAGSSKLGKRVMVGGQAGIMGHIEVGDDVVVSARSFMSKSTSGKGVYTSAIPSQPHSEWMRNAVHFKHLNEMSDRIRTLEKKLQELENKS
jgi:UDP-3-O-[3-hydroxymyristoyl] glucosamine N-acyltransferase